MNIRHRVRTTKAALAQMRGSILGKGVSRATKMKLVKSILFSRLFYNAGVWRPLTKAEHCELRACYVEVLRTVGGLRNHEDRHLTDSQVMVAMKVPSCSAMLAYRQLLYLPRIAKAAPEVLKALLDQKYKRIHGGRG